MRTLALLAAVLMFAGCAGVIDNCPKGLSDPPQGSSIPDPHR